MASRDIGNQQDGEAPRTTSPLATTSVLNSTAQKKSPTTDFISHDGRPDAEIQVRTAVKAGEWPLTGVYRMLSDPRGYAIIINNIDFDDGHERRDGAEHDLDDMNRLLSQMYFEVQPHKNLKAEDMVKKLQSFAGKGEWIHVDCAVIVIMSHGNFGESVDETIIYGTDGREVLTRDIIGYFNNSICTGLLDKPKIFIFQACRGTNGNNPGIERQKANRINKIAIDGRQDTNSASFDFISNDNDIFVAYAVPPGKTAIRSTNTGAWFIQAIIDVFIHHAWQHDLDTLMEKVNEELEKKSNKCKVNNFQTAETRKIGWKKHLFFNPGIRMNGNLQGSNSLEISDENVQEPDILILLQLVRANFKSNILSSRVNILITNTSKIPIEDNLVGRSKKEISRSPEWNEYFVFKAKPTNTKIQLKFLRKSSWDDYFDSMNKCNTEFSLPEMLLEEPNAEFSHKISSLFQGFEGFVTLKYWNLTQSNFRMAVNDDPYLPSLSEVLSLKQKKKYVQLYVEKSSKFKINVRWSNIIEDSFDIVSQVENLSRLRSNFVINDGQMTIDEWLRQILEAFVDPKHNLLVNSAKDPWGMYRFNPAAVSEKDLQHFDFFGRCYGIMINHGITFGNIYFTRPFFKMMLGKPVELHDLYYSITSSEHNLEKEVFYKITQLCKDPNQCFALPVDDKNRVEQSILKHNGEYLAVNDENRLEFISLCIQKLYIDRVQKQMKAFMKGFTAAIPENWTNLFDEFELEFVLSGVSKNYLKERFATWKESMLCFEGFVTLDPVQEWLFDVMERFDKFMIAKWQIFLTGTSKWPNTVFLKVTKANNFGIVLKGDSQVYTLCLPTYDKIEDLEKDLIDAITLKVLPSNLSNS